MENKSRGNKESHEEQDLDGKVRSEYTLGDNQEDHTAATNGNPQEHKKRQQGPGLRGAWKQTSVANKIIAGSAIATALATAVYAYVSHGQLGVLSKQLGQMTDSSKQTDRMIDEAQKIRSAMELSNTQNRKAVADTLAQSKRALDASIEASRLDQRAWVGMRMATGAAPFKTDAPGLTIGQKIVMGAIVINSGKTPALHMKGKTDTMILPRDTPFTPRFRPFKELYMFADITLTPGGTMAMMASPSDEVVTQKLIDELKSSSKLLYLFGSFTYKDAFGFDHFTKFCMLSTADLGAMVACGTYNEAN